MSEGSDGLDPTSFSSKYIVGYSWIHPFNLYSCRLLISKTPPICIVKPLPMEFFWDQESTPEHPSPLFLSPPRPSESEAASLPSPAVRVAGAYPQSPKHGCIASRTSPNISSG